MQNHSEVMANINDDENFDLKSIPLYISRSMHTV